jgi:hypothetical protein
MVMTTMVHVAGQVLLLLVLLAVPVVSGAADRDEPGERACMSEATQIDPGSTVAQASCIPASRCCKICRKGQACGNSCIRADYTCHKGQGCACNSYEVCR